MGNPGLWSARNRSCGLALALVVALLQVLGAVGSARAATVTEFIVPSDEDPSIGDSAFDIAAGPDGNMWFTVGGAAPGHLGRITPAGMITKFFAGPSVYHREPADITAGPDGNLWFTEYRRDRVSRVTPAGKVNGFSAGLSPDSVLTDIAAGPDGNVWFTESAGRVGRITPAGKITEFSAGISARSKPAGIAAGPDGNLWFTESAGDRVGRITPAGKVTEFHAGISADSEPDGIAAGPDGNLWFTESAGRVGRITPNGKVTEFSAGITPRSEPSEITAGPDGNLWFTEFESGRIGRITPSGRVTEFTAGITPNNLPTGIAAGPDGGLWFTQSDRIGRITTSTGSAVAIQTRRARVSTRGFATVELACGAGSSRCAGKVVVTIRNPNPQTELPIGSPTITLARARFSLPAGQHATIKLRLTRNARRRVARAKRRRLSTQVRAITRDGDAWRNLTLIAPRRA